MLLINLRWTCTKTQEWGTLSFFTAQCLHDLVSSSVRLTSSLRYSFPLHLHYGWKAESNEKKFNLLTFDIYFQKDMVKEMRKPLTVIIHVLLNISYIFLIFTLSQVTQLKIVSNPFAKGFRDNDPNDEWVHNFPFIFYNCLRWH